MATFSVENMVKKVAEQALDEYLINGKSLREWIALLSDEQSLLDKIKTEIEKVAERHNQRPEINYDTAYSDGLYGAITIINRIVESEGEG